MKALLVLLGCWCLLFNGFAVEAGFEFEFEIIRHITNGNCAGIDFTIECETFVSDFCLRDGSYYMSMNQDRDLCTLGTNTTRVFTITPAVRIIRSTQFWDGFFELFMVAHDDDFPATTTDILDFIFISSPLPANNAFGAPVTVFGIHNRVGVEIRYRVRCAENFYTGQCSVFCEPRDDELGHYTCHPNDGTLICNFGYENPETNCVDLITVCNDVPYPCVRGTCNPIGQLDFSCTCPVGYTGTTCDEEINECDPGPCENGGSCLDLIGGYECSCLPGFTGQDCEVDIDDCQLVQCPGNATCIDGINSHQCVCDPGFEGLLCVESNPCDSNPCVNSNCLKIDRFLHSCVCFPGYTGPTCETNIDDCSDAVCTMNSTCVDGLQSYTCVCLPGFEPSEGNCTEPDTAPTIPNTDGGAVIGAAVGILVGLILLFLVVIVIVVILIGTRRGKSKEYVIPEDATGENTYEVRPSINIEEPAPVLLSHSTQPLINNPMYSTTAAPQPVPTKQDTIDTPEFDAELSPAYSTLRDISNPLYGSDSFNAGHTKAKEGPIYSEPDTLKRNKTEPPKGADNYPYSYAMIHGSRKPDASIKAPLPNGIPTAQSEAQKDEAQKGAEYEEIPLKRRPAPKPGIGARTQSGYEIPKVLTEKKPTAPLVYHYATTNSTPPKLAQAKTTAANNSPQKKSIYDSQDDDEPCYKTPKPVPPPRTSAPEPETPVEYSYATTNGSVKIKTSEAKLPSYDKLEHDLGSDVPSNQVRLAKIEGSGYTALDTD